MTDIYAIILAGGSGSGLWPLSRQSLPKQFLALNGDDAITAHQNQNTYIPRGTKHRLENRENEPLHIAEVQVGDYLGEDDITRYDDHYGR